MGGTKVRNERLAEAMARMRMSSADLAAVAEVDPRTIDRWVADWSRIPRAESRHALAETLQVPAGMLWPNAATGPQVTDELLALYPSRAATPVGLVTSLLADATEEIDVLVLAGVWLWDAVPGFAAALGAKARAGVTVRVCLGDPAGETVRRGASRKRSASCSVRGVDLRGRTPSACSQTARARFGCTTPRSMHRSCGSTTIFW